MILLDTAYEWSLLSAILREEGNYIAQGLQRVTAGRVGFSPSELISCQPVSPLALKLVKRPSAFRHP